MSSSSSSHENEKEVILIIEDDRPLRDGLAMNLRIHGYEVITAADGEEGMKMAFDARPDLVLLDIMMPCWTGLDILEEMRKRGKRVPVLILSARDSTADKVEGLGLGADDYMTKPFDLPELIARVEARLREKRRKKTSIPILVLGDITIDRVKRNVQVRGKKIELSAKEFDILCLLAGSPGQVFTREKILEHVWGWDYDGTARTVDNFVAGLRKKLSIGRRSARYIQTVPRVGYKIEADVKS